MIEPHFENILETIISKIESAKTNIRICMAWFTDQDIMDSLIIKVKEGLNVELILFDTKNNKYSQIHTVGIKQLKNFKVTLSNFKEAGGNVILIRENYDFYLHSKFCIIDEKVIITGSYNWSYPARTHIENIIVVEDSDVAIKYKLEFEKIKEKKLSLVLERNFPKCREPNCGGNLIKMRLFNKNDNSGYFSEEHVDFEICDSDLSHITNISRSSSWNLYVDDLYEIEYEKLQILQETEEVNQETLKRNINEQLAAQVGSRNDLFSTQLQNEILVLGKVTTVLSGYDDEETIIKILWNHEITNNLIDYLPDYYEQIIETVHE